MTANTDRLAAAVLPSDAPEEVGVGWIVEHFGVSPATVTHRIRTGALPARAIPGRGSSVFYAIRPEHAAAIWGHRLIRKTAAAV